MRFLIVKSVSRTIVAPKMCVAGFNHMQYVPEKTLILKRFKKMWVAMFNLGEVKKLTLTLFV